MFWWDRGKNAIRHLFTRKKNEKWKLNYALPKRMCAQQQAIQCVVIVSELYTFAQVKPRPFLTNFVFVSCTHGDLPCVIQTYSRVHSNAGKYLDTHAKKALCITHNTQMAQNFSMYSTFFYTLFHVYVFRNFAFQPFWNSIGKIWPFECKVNKGQTGLTNTCKMMHDDIFQIRNKAAQAYGKSDQARKERREKER